MRNDVAHRVAEEVLALKLSLLVLANQELLTADRASSSGHELTVHGDDSSTLHQSMVSLRAGESWSLRPHPAEATLLVLKGRVLLSSDGHAWQGSTGDLLELPPGEGGVEALEDAAVLVTTAAEHELLGSTMRT